MSTEAWITSLMVQFWPALGRYCWNGSKKGLQESSSWQLLNHWAWSTLSDVHVDALEPVGIHENLPSPEDDVVAAAAVTKRSIEGVWKRCPRGAAARVDELSQAHHGRPSCHGHATVECPEGDLRVS